jgi:hypothetical protein
MSESLIGLDARTILIVDDIPANLAVAADYPDSEPVPGHGCTGWAGGHRDASHTQSLPSPTLKQFAI